MPSSRTSVKDLAKTFAGVDTPIYLVGADRVVLFVNAACEQWIGANPETLLGVECRYHSSPDVVGAERAAALLCPPPEAFTGLRRSAEISAPGTAGISVRTVDFLPLVNAQGEVEAVLGVAQPAETASAASAAERDGEAPDQHALLQRFRAKLRGRYQLERIVGESSAMRRVRAQVQAAAGIPSTVSITGPAGSGRSHAARTIHFSQADAGSLVPLSCLLLGPELLESSVRSLLRTSGKRPATLLLTDVDQASEPTQAYLVQLLSGAPAFRVISTAQRPLVQLAAAGEFDRAAADLLSTLTIEIPPLAARRDDLPLLAQMFLEEANARSSKQLAGIRADAMELLSAYAWPGNLAELATMIAAAHESAEGPEITVRDLPARLRHALDATARPKRRDEAIDLGNFLAEVERELIERALKRAKGNKTKAARMLGMTRPRLYRRLVQMGLAEEIDSSQFKPAE